MKYLVVLALVFVAIQLVPVDRTSPPNVGEIQAPPDVKPILERSCYDCHSHQTRWPWYSRVAPVSWLVAYDVHEAREHMNFSRWGELTAEEQADAIEEVWEEVEEEEMPLWYYLPVHPDARLGDEERETLRRWAASVSHD